MVLAFAGAEVIFKAVCGYNYLDLAGARTPAERWEALTWFAAVSLPFTAVFFVALYGALAPVRRWRRLGDACDDATLRRAGETLHHLPIRAGWLWTLEWGATFVVLLTVRPVTCVPAAALFFATIITGPHPIAGPVAFWCAARDIREVSIRARERGVALRTPARRVRTLLAVFCMLMAVTPTTYVASFAFSAKVL